MFRLVMLLARTPGAYVASQEIMREIWNADELDRDYRPVYDQMKRFKEQAERTSRSNAMDPDTLQSLILSSQGKGYMLNVQPGKLEVR